MTANSHIWPFKFQLVKVEWYYECSSSGTLAAFPVPDAACCWWLLPWQCRSRTLPPSQGAHWVVTLWESLPEWWGTRWLYVCLAGFRKTELGHSVQTAERRPRAFQCVIARDPQRNASPPRHCAFTPSVLSFQQRPRKAQDQCLWQATDSSLINYLFCFHCMCFYICFPVIAENSVLHLPWWYIIPFQNKCK